MNTRWLESLVITLGLATLGIAGCTSDDEGGSDSVGDGHSTTSSGSSTQTTGVDTSTTNDTSCIPGEQGCSCSGGLCLGDLVCENDLCTDPNCMFGELACECNMGLCLGDLVCVGGVCLEDGGTTTDTTSTDTDTTTDTGMECPNPNEMMCDGVCVDVVENNANCGGCGVVCKVYDVPNPDIGTCVDGACSPTFTDCVAKADGLVNCDQICGAVGTVCVEEGCNGDTSITTSSPLACDTANPAGVDGTPQFCGTAIPWNGNLYGACCCEQN